VGEAGAVAETGLTVALETPAARVLADQSATIADLQFVMDCCKRLLTELAKPEKDRDLVVALALWSAALVTYARCFTAGRRLGLGSDDVRSLPLHGEVMKFHKWVLAERDKLTTHPADPFTEAKVGAAVDQPEQAKPAVAGIAIMSSCGSSSVLRQSWRSRSLAARRTSRTSCSRTRSASASTRSVPCRHCAPDLPPRTQGRGPRSARCRDLSVSLARRLQA
jgi:hypothetical protein